MLSQRQYYEQRVRDYLAPRYPELIREMSMALRAFDAALSSGVLTRSQLKTLVESAHSQRQPLGENTAALLGELAPRFPEAARAVREMIKHSKSHVRMNALVAISSTEPTTLHRDLLRVSLKDRSSKVRLLAADKIMQFGLGEILADLETAIERERTPGTRAKLERERDLLRDGYHLHYRDPNTVWITCRLLSGSTRGAMITGEDLRTKGAKAIAGELVER